MNVAHVMEREVVTVPPTATLKDAAALLVRHRISGLPVCTADGRVVGVISQADIVVKEIGEDASGDGRRLRAVSVSDGMTSPAVTIGSSAPVGAAAKLMTARRVNRLPVVDGDRLLGIVTRSDLVRAFARSDAAIDREIREDVLLETLCVSPWSLTVAVHDGVVTLRGRVETKSFAELVARYVRRVPGVVAVQSDLSWSADEPSSDETRFGLGFLRNI